MNLMCQSLLFVSSFFFSLSLTASCCGGDSHPWPPALSAKGGVGYRQDKFNWSIAGPHGDPNILSELEWEDLEMVQAYGEFRYVSCTNYVIKIEGDVGHIYSGHNTDSDYHKHDRKDLFSRSENKAGKGFVYDAQAAVGYQYRSTCSRFVAAPLIGWSFHEQSLHLFDGISAFEAAHPGTIRPLVALDSTYRARWSGPWIGGDFTARVESCAYVFGGIECHLARYHGLGNWNLRPEIRSFIQRANGYGFIARLGGNWDIWDNWSLGVLGEYRRFCTRKGSDHLNVIAENGDLVSLRSRLNLAKWEAAMVSAFVSWRY